MDSPVEEDWKKNVGFQINYSPGSSDDDFDSKDVVFRNPRQSSALLADSGDGTEADMLGTTPPRSRIRRKEMLRRKFDPSVTQRIVSKDVTDHASSTENNSPDRPLFKKRPGVKQLRAWQRDSKQDMAYEVKCDSLPPTSTLPGVPTLVDTSNRFMSLTSRPKNRELTDQDRAAELEEEDRWRVEGDEELPASRVNFHRTFSLLINMGNIEKGCKRAISREEQVWQNELKDLIWLELQAKLAGRSPAQQDAYLCAQRDFVPSLIDTLLHYKFVNKNPCRRMKKDDRTNAPPDLDTDQADKERESIDEEEEILGCLSFECQQCSDAIGAAMREVGALLDRFHSAGALYPSTRAMTLEHPELAEPAFNNRIKAMCLWYNTALHMRLTIFALLRMLRSIKHKNQPRGARHRTSMDSDISRRSSESHRPGIVRFNISSNTTDSSNSDSSAQSDLKEAGEMKESDEAKESDGVKESDDPKVSIGTKESNNAKMCHQAVEGSEQEKEVEERCDVVDSYFDSNKYNGVSTPEILVGDRPGTSDTSTSAESGYASFMELPPTGLHAHTFDSAALAELSQIRLLNKCAVSLYREYHREVLKTQGVRRSMMFISKMRTNLLDKVYLTLVKPQSAQSESTIVEEEPAEVFDEPNCDDKQEAYDDEEIKNYELRRYGCWSEECLSMRLPSYRSHFLLISSICMEAVHDYLSFRLEATPDRPSCLTVKQLIHELREGLDISSEMRADFVRHARAALAPRAASRGEHLAPLLRTYDHTVHTMFKKYLSYLTTMSETEGMPRATLQAEWAFTARLATRIRCAAQLAPLAFSNITCNQLKRLLGEFRQESGKWMVDESERVDPSKEAIYAVCRSMQSMYACSRDTALQTAQWARALAARLARAPPPAYVQQRGDMFNCIMAIRDFIYKHIVLVLEKSRPLLGEELSRELNDALIMRVRELLLQIYKLGFELHKELHRFVNEASSRPGCGIQGSPPPLGRKSKFMRTDSIVEDYQTSAGDERLFENVPTDGQAHTIDVLGEHPPVDEQVELRNRPGRSVNCEEKQWASRVARAVIEFAKCWMRFAVDRCDRGRGLRPRWASQGLDFLMLACDPCNTKHLSDEEFEELKQLMDGCISHVVGSRPAPSPRPSDTPVPATPAPHSPRPRPRLPSPFPSYNSREPLLPATPPSEPYDQEALLNYPEAESVVHRHRVLEAINRVDRERDIRLQNTKSVGKVLESAVTSYEPKLRQLTFKWQRGLKIGAGTFGKVYTVVNTESGQLLAMKELAIGVGDRRALQRAANELRVLEGVIHPHLVRYYGCELHREEMLIFMELCVEGSLEALVATSGALAEHTARRYTKQLVSAVVQLHARSIAHRDIKSGNIFLTNEGHCLKLGDFGCAVKIRANSTAPGELQGYVGTQAYMAPEVFMKSSGHGRAADIWSLGCVVTEMASGKRPFSEYDSNYQIMFVVGMGGRPAVPESLSEEGREFCCACLTHDPDQRPRAETLTLHHFLLVKSDEDCKCEPGYLKT